MTSRSASGSVLGTQFDDFLLAPVFDERNGPLSVLSALARLDVDPWHTAATLAQLPRPVAAQELASMFAGLPDRPADRDAIAARVVSFLPSQALNPVGTVPTGRQAIGQRRNFALIYVISMLISLLVQDLVLSHKTGPGAVAAGARVSGAVVFPRPVIIAP